MSKLPMVELGELLVFSRKSNIRAGEGKEEGTFKFFTSSNIQNKYIDSYIFEKPSLIFGTGGNASVHYCSEPFSTSADCLVATSKNENVNLETVFLYLVNNIRLLEAGFKGAGLKHISKEFICKIEIPLPPIGEQKRIAAVLNKAQGLIDICKKQITELNVLIKSNFVKMFGSEYELDRWNKTDINSVADVTVGVVIKPAQYYTDETKGIKAFRSLNIGEMYIRNDNWVYFTPEGHAVNNKSELKTGDVLIVRSGYPGTSCVVTDEYSGCNAIDVIIARPDRSMINPVYLCAFTNFPHGKNQVIARTGGAAQQHFNVGEYKAMTISLPPIVLQNEFADFVLQAEKSKLEKQKSLVQMKRLYSALMQQAFS